MNWKVNPSSTFLFAASPSDPGTCSYYCSDNDYALYQDDAGEGHYCEASLGYCDLEGDTVTVAAWSDGSDPDPPDPDGALGLLASSKPKSALPKNSALYRFHPDRKVLRRIRGAWAKGHYTPLEMNLKELASFAPTVHKIVSVMAKNKSVVAFEVVISSKKSPKKKKVPSSATAKNKSAKPKTAVKAKGLATKPSSKKSVKTKSLANKSSPKKRSSKA